MLEAVVRQIVNLKRGDGLAGASGHQRFPVIQKDDRGAASRCQHRPRRSPAIRVRMKDFGRIGEAIPADGASHDEHCSIIQGDTHMIGARGQHGGDAPEPSSPFETLFSRQRPAGVVSAYDE